MKWIPLVILIIGIVLAAGCTSPSQPVTTPATTIATPTATPTATVPATTAVPPVPDLLGNWSGTSVGYLYQSGYQPYNDTLVMSVTRQEGPLFTGQILFPQRNGSMATKQFAGAMDSDGLGFELIEYPSGFANGVFVSANEVQLVYRDTGTQSNIAIDRLRLPGAGTAAPEPAMPDLLGTWTGLAVGYIEESGYVEFNESITMKVTAQDGRLLTGEVSFPFVNGTIVTKEFAGALSPDGKYIATIEYPYGFTDGDIVSADEIEIVFCSESGPSTITIDSLRRTAAPFTPAAKPKANLVGNWTGTSSGYVVSATGSEAIEGSITMKVTEQKDRFFRGQVSYQEDGTLVTKNFAGVFTRDGKNIETIESPDGFTYGTIVSDNEIRLVFRDDVNPPSISIDSFRRMK